MYDGRIGRRWNVDPVYNTDISRYAINGNNPLYFLDPNGDFRTKFGAQLYNLFKYGGKGDVRRASSTHPGEYSYGKKIANQWFVAKVEKVEMKTTDENGFTPFNIEIVYSKTFEWKEQGDGTPQVGDVIDEVAGFVKDNARDAWHSPAARSIVPDYYTLSFSGSTSSGIIINEEGTLTLLLRGKDPGIYFNTTTGSGVVTSVGIDVGCSVGKGYYIGDALQLSSSMLGGWQGSGSVGFGLKAISGGSINGGVDVGFGPDGQITTVTRKVGISVGIGVSTPILQGGLGAGKATNAIPILKF